jgi:very-short-patch-repair endonuclease
MANQIARALRKKETIAEKRLWMRLRTLRAQGYYFRRQAPIDSYIVDFACFSHRLIIEVDGIQHHTPEGLKRDAERDAHLKWQGFSLLRFCNGEVAQNIDGVIWKFWRHLEFC